MAQHARPNPSDILAESDRSASPPASILERMEAVLSATRSVLEFRNLLSRPNETSRTEK